MTPGASDAIRTLRFEKEILIDAPLAIAFEALVEELGAAGEMPGGAPFPMVLEPWPGGRWYRDLGNNTGHLWAHVQAIKPPTLLELCGPLFMSFAAANNIQYRLSAEGERTKLKMVHRAMGELSDELRAGMSDGWTFRLERTARLAESRVRSK